MNKSDEKCRASQQDKGVDKGIAWTAMEGNALYSAASVEVSQGKDKLKTRP